MFFWEGLVYFLGAALLISILALKSGLSSPYAREELVHTATFDDMHTTLIAFGLSKQIFVSTYVCSYFCCLHMDGGRRITGRGRE